MSFSYSVGSSLWDLTHRTARVVGAAAMIAVLLAACGGSTPASNKGSITVMTVAPWANPEINYLDGALTGQYAAEWINQHGGINGTQIKVIICNDFFRADGAQTCARQAVAAKVVALVGGLTVFDGSMLPILESAQIPWIGNIPFQTGAYTSPVNYPIVNGGFDRTALADVAGKNCQRVALVDAGQGSATDIPYLNAGLKVEGKSYVTRVSVTASAPDYSGFAAAVKTSNPDCLMLDINGVEVQRLIPALQQAGVSTAHAYSSLDNFTDPGVVKALGSQMNGWLVASYFSDYNSDAWSDYRNAMQQSNILVTFPGAKINGSSDMNAWASYQVLKEVVSQISGPVTSAAIINQLKHTTKLNVGNLTPTLDFSKPNSNPSWPRIFNPYSTVLTIKDSTTQPGPFVDAVAIYQKASG